jgi:pyruvate dehydrogenase E2 component (dihydrolipoamide acetyltransferase)
MPDLEVIMPRLSDTMEEGLVARWLKHPGDAVARGDEIAEIETDKVTVTLEAEGDGFLLETFAAAGASVPPGTVLALIGAEQVRTPSAPTSESSVRHAGPLRATPLARKLAAGAGLALGTLARGSGPDGRILRQDVERAISGRAADLREITKLHRATAQRLTRAKQETPHYYLDADVDMTDLLQLRAGLNELDEPLNVSVTAFIVRAVALALREVPEVNAIWKNDTVEPRSSVDIGLAVALDDDWVVVPVIRGADQGAISEVAQHVRELTERARAQRLTQSEVVGASFSITSLGMDGVDSFHAIINPPESGILAVGTISARPAVHRGELCVREIGRLSLSADHRVYSGRTAARFLTAIKRGLEQPDSLVASE